MNAYIKLNGLLIFQSGPKDKLIDKTESKPDFETLRLFLSHSGR